MAAATANRDGQRSDGKLKSHKLAAAAVYKDTLAVINATGYAESATDAAAKTFVGVFAEGVDNSGGSAGDLSARVYKKGEFTFAFGAANATQATVGQEVCITDNQTVDLAATTTNDIKCGKVVELLAAGSVRVRIDNYTA